MGGRFEYQLHCMDNPKLSLFEKNEWVVRRGRGPGCCGAWEGVAGLLLAMAVVSLEKWAVRNGPGRCGVSLVSVSGL